MKKVVVSGIKMPVRHTEEEVLEKAQKILKKCGISSEIMTVYKKSLDARRKSDIHFEYSVAAEVEKTNSRIPNQRVRVLDDQPLIDWDELKRKSCGKRVVVVGSGPCGLFAAYVLSMCGVDVTVLERGSDVDKRTSTVNKFWKEGVLDPNTNIQFGEGGAGTFSDGKLNTRVGDPLQRFVLETFVKNGAPKEILYKAKPHIGTDFLKTCVKNLRKEIEGFGGKIMFDTCMTDIKVTDGCVSGAKINNSSYIDCDAIILALGHSSRDTYETLYSRGVAMEQKPFAAGVRIEHRREFINKVQYGNCPDAEYLPTADYRLVYNGEDRSCYSFCMCPGGVVVNASSEPEMLNVNGMSFHSRMEDNSNSALVVSVRPDDFGSDSPLAGIEFQRKYEALAYRCGGGKGPVQLAKDFASDRVSCDFNGVMPSFTGDIAFVDLHECLPSFISKTLNLGLNDFDKKMKGFLAEGAILTGVEMRTSAPLRILRNEKFESISHKGLYPAGEGAGYAGGIMSAAIDGIKVAKSILEN